MSWPAVDVRFERRVDRIVHRGRDPELIAELDDLAVQGFQLTYTGAALQGVAGIYYIDANAFNIFDVILAAPRQAAALGLEPYAR